VPDPLTLPSTRATYPDLAGKTAVVTGGSRGIGAATARALAANGVAVAVVGRDRQALAEVAASIESQGGRALPVVADCRVDDDLAAMGEQVHAAFGPVDVIAAFAGGYGMPVPSRSETAAHWRQVVDADLTATFLTITALLPDLVARRGVVVTMASSSARQATPAAAAYAAAKAGVVALTRHLAGELAADGVRCNCLAPAAVENERMRRFMDDDQRRQMAASFPLGRVGQPEDVAAATLFLASEASSWITGITLDVAGGRVMP
jgi:3-oxoacyl-[acyl-carrier protein] reductase